MAEVEELQIQTERAFQKQEGINPVSAKKNPRRHRNKAGKLRYFKNVGLGFVTPKEAKEGDYIDKKCPFTSKLLIRGKIMRGRVIKHKMKRTIIIRRDSLFWVKKYQRYEKRHRNTPVHLSPAFSVQVGDEVIVGESRPLSKTVRFNVLKVIPKGRKVKKAVEEGKKDVKKPVKKFTKPTRK
eukprot:TRINITY_DN2927_c0_g2_i1.p2 TRINITY_DN2927_c0_g2~~TRINITY_DN2927_c0_g2_i1.p2  ORF type:complete len:182 (-),score=45.15 TRINITY_DN2927_c0_g2_i1:208-753(-)